MAYPDVKEAQGCTFICGTSSWTAEILDIKKSGPKFDKLDTTKLSSTVAKESIRSSLYDPGEFDLTVHFNPDNPYPLTNTGETYSILYPAIGTATGNTQRSQTASAGYILEAPHSVMVGKIMEGTIKICCTGAQSHTNTA